MNLSTVLKDPFRFFFPLGMLAGAIGVGLWLPMAWGDLSSYPILAHRFLMMGGFMLAFATGFLTTAIPRFTSTEYLRSREFYLLMIGHFGAVYFAVSANQPGHYLSVVFAITVLLLFGTRRFLNRQENPPFTFVFIGAGLLLWWLASVLLTLYQFHFEPVFFSQAKAIYTHGALLCLVIGVGGRLVPGLLGWTSIVKEQRSRYENTDSFKNDIPLLLWLALLVFLSSYLLEGIFDLKTVWLMRAVVITYVAVRYWKLYRFPKERTGFTWGVWVSSWSFVIGMLVPVLWPASGTHGFHTIFIGGFSLLTILVATRVTLAHGTEGKELESTSRTLKILVGLLVFAMLTRLSAFIWPRVYHSHLGYASLLWLAGIISWAVILLPRMLADYEPQQ